MYVIMPYVYIPTQRPSCFFRPTKKASASTSTHPPPPPSPPPPNTKHKTRTHTHPDCLQRGPAGRGRCRGRHHHHDHRAGDADAGVQAEQQPRLHEPGEGVGGWVVGGRCLCFRLWGGCVFGIASTTPLGWEWRVLCCLGEGRVNGCDITNASTPRKEWDMPQAARKHTHPLFLCILVVLTETD